MIHLNPTIVCKFLSLPLLATATYWSAMGCAQAASIVTGGHIDGPAFGYVSGEGFDAHFHNEGGDNGAIIDGLRITTDKEYEADELVIAIPVTSTTTVGSTTYFWLPETEQEAADQGAPFLGIGLEELDPLEWVDSILTLRILEIRGPGQLLLWQDNGFGGETIFFNTGNNVNSYTLVPGSHTHYNWGFTVNGTYEIDFGIEGRHVDDGFIIGQGTYTFVIPEPSSCLLGLLGALAVMRRRR